MAEKQLTNHVALVLDASGSMARHTTSLIKVADDLVAYLARRSKELNQETRISIYTFSGITSCLVWDMDVLRAPSIRTLYRASGTTAMIAATMSALDDLAKIPEIHCDHAFLAYVLTDGEEQVNVSWGPKLSEKLMGFGENWTVAAVVPDQTAKFEARKMGFPGGNIDVWNTQSDRGTAEAGTSITRSLNTYMTGRAAGVRGTVNLFADASVLNENTVAAAGLRSLTASEFKLIPVAPGSPKELRDFVIHSGLRYRMGSNFYQLMKPETIQPQKAIAIFEKATGKVFTGAQARQLLGLGDVQARVRPTRNPSFDVFVQSTANNRHLMVGTKLLVLS